MLDGVKPEFDQFKDIKAPHFVQMVKSQLESELGQTTVGAGGLTVKTTLDYRAQDRRKAITDLFNSSIPNYARFDNAAVTVMDVQTSQVLALLGSRDYNYPNYGYVNSADAFLQPGFKYQTVCLRRPCLSNATASTTDRVAYCLMNRFRKASIPRPRGLLSKTLTENFAAPYLSAIRCPNHAIYPPSRLCTSLGAS